MRRLALLAVAAAVLASAVALSASPSRAERVAPTGAHTIFFLNTTGQTVWLAAWPGSAGGRTGWKVGPHLGGSFKVPVGWRGRVWGRTGCRFEFGLGGCRTGDCRGRVQCRGPGKAPATLAEFALDSVAGLDFYDVSMAEGSNLPMYVRVIHGLAEQSVDANGCLRPGVCTHPVRCPKALRVSGGGRRVAACASPCDRFGGARYCCRGRFAAHCSPARDWPVDWAKAFERAEPFALAWPGDDRHVFTCREGCDFEVVFGVSPPGADEPPARSRR